GCTLCPYTTPLPIFGGRSCRVGNAGVVEMDNLRQYRISLFGEFTDKSMEDEYLADSLTRSTKLTAYIALVFGSTLGLFLVHSYIDRKSTRLNSSHVK